MSRYFVLNVTRYASRLILIYNAKVSGGRLHRRPLEGFVILVVCFMPFNPSPKVAEARDLAKKYGQTKVIIIMIDDTKGTMEYASFGRDKAMCLDAGKLADVAYKAIYDHLSR